MAVNVARSLLTGALLVLIFPRFDFTFLAPVALVPLVVACAREPNWVRRFLFGWAGGTFFWFFVCTWIQYVLEVHGGMGRWGGWGTFLLFAILKGLHTALFAAVTGVLLRSEWAVPLVAALWAGIEYAHGSLGLAWIGLGFAWLDLGNAAIDWPLLMRLAPVTGVHGISFALATVSVAIALVVLRRPVKQLLPLVALLGLFLFPALPPQVEGREKARVVQTNVDVEALWTEDSWARFQAELAQKSLGDPVSLLVWPEAPVPFYPSRPAFASYMANIARSTNADFVMGGIAMTESGDPLNSVFFTNPAGEIKDRYDKIQLVPFGEYIPPAFDWVNRITGEAGDYVPGTRVVTYEASGRRIGAFICYESAFPGLVRQFTKAGAQLLLNLSNDGYFGGSKAREQHLSLVRMRAAENGRWILRSTNDGITAMVDPAGRVTERLPEYQRTPGTLRFNYESGVTLYVRWGDWFPWACLVVSLVAALKYIGPLRSMIKSR